MIVKILDEYRDNFIRDGYEEFLKITQIEIDPNSHPDPVLFTQIPRTECINFCKIINSPYRDYYININHVYEVYEVPNFTNQLDEILDI
jgi:hypothetical protein